MTRVVQSCVLSAFVFLLCVSATAQHGAITMPRTLPDLVSPAGAIVRGHIISAYVEPHPQFANLKTVVVTVSTDSMLKGTASKTYSFRQYIWDERDVANAAGYRKGQEWLLILNAPNQNGLTSPVGLEQGRFRVVRDASGAATAVNGRHNAGLFNGANAKAQQNSGKFTARAMRMMSTTTSGPVALEDLEDAIRGFVGVAK